MAKVTPWKPNKTLVGTISYEAIGPVGTIEFTLPSELFDRRNRQIMQADLENVVEAHMHGAKVVHWRVFERAGRDASLIDAKETSSRT